MSVVVETAGRQGRARKLGQQATERPKRTRRSDQKQPANDGTDGQQTAHTNYGLCRDCSVSVQSTAANESHPDRFAGLVITGWEDSVGMTSHHP